MNLLQHLSTLSEGKKLLLFSLFALLVSSLVNLAFFELELEGLLLILTASVSILYIIIVLNKPIVGLFTIIGIAFFSTLLSREIVQLPYSTIMEAMMVVTFLGALYAYGVVNQKLLHNDLSLLMLLWFILSVLEIANPERPNFQGAVGELRTIAAYPLILTLSAFLVLKTNKQFSLAIKVFIFFSLLAALWGIKQQHWGLSSGDQEFLDDGGSITHLLWGKLRVFSFFDAARFGCLMAQFAVITSVLMFSKISNWKRLILFCLTAIFVYGMLIAGTRTALIVIVAGAFFALLVCKNFKLFLVGGVFMVLFLAFLKFTYIGNSNYEIYRLRSALNPQDASLNVRFDSQNALRIYLQDKPFGAGLGVTGYFGHKFNADKFPSTIEPDSFWVKVWVMYGVVGLVLWFSMYLYLFGKCFGIIWKIRDNGLRFRLIAMASSSFGIFFCSYGNEIINTMPSMIVVAVSLVMVYRGPTLDRELAATQLPLS